jgi:hypothetical protein
MVGVALLVGGCGEEAQKKQIQQEAEADPSVPLAIPCVACGEKVSKKTKECRQCGHPTLDSLVAYKRKQTRWHENLPNGLSRNEDGKVMAELLNGTQMDVAKKVREISGHMKASPSMTYPKIRDALVRGGFSPEVVNYIINEVEALEKE